jgi:4-phytase/acid phosphatase
MMLSRTLLPGLAVAGLLLGTAASAAPASAEHIKLEIVLMRHGVRSPTAAPEKLDVYASGSWPAWPVAPGMLTSHGEQGMFALGKHYRQRLIAQGIWSGQCPTDAAVQVIADSTPRNQDSAAQFIGGMAPDCKAGYRGLPSDEKNQLFHYVAKGGSDKDDDDATAVATAPLPPAMAELQRVLLGCNDDACLAAAQANGKQTLLEKGNAKAIKTAGSLSENIMLSYVQGMPSGDVGWGRADLPTLGRLITLHNAEFGLTKKSLPAATRAGSNLMAHILATLNSAARRKGTVQALAPTGTRAIVLIGHDTNLANIAGVLGVDWHDADRPDDYPPGGALVFDLVEDHGHYGVRTHVLMPSMDALRNNDFDAADGIVQRTVSLAGCKQAAVCTLDEFTASVNRRIDAAYVDQAVPVMGERH